MTPKPLEEIALACAEKIVDSSLFGEGLDEVELRKDIESTLLEVQQQERERLSKLVEVKFQMMRFDAKTHEGLGDIRLSIGTQEEIVEAIKTL